MLVSCRPERKIIRGFNPPRWLIQRRMLAGYSENSIRVASGLVTAWPRAPKSQAAWKPRLARDVTQMRSGETAPRTMVQADAHRPSIMMLSLELRRLWYLSM